MSSIDPPASIVYIGKAGSNATKGETVRDSSANNRKRAAFSGDRLCKVPQGVFQLHTVKEITVMLKMTRKTAIRSAMAGLVGAGLIAMTGSAFAVTLQQIKDRGFARVAVANEIPYGYVDVSGKAKGAGP